jgi:5-methyltetrahydrofolate--homocysteine methyltransferase
MDDTGIPHDAEMRFNIASRLITHLGQSGIPHDDIYIDPLIQPVSTATSNASSAIEAIRMIKQSYPDVHYICGLSNISFGLPERKLINHTFLVLCLAAGLDAAILDPNDKKNNVACYCNRDVNRH